MWFLGTIFKQSCCFQANQLFLFCNNNYKVYDAYQQKHAPKQSTKNLSYVKHPNNYAIDLIISLPSLSLSLHFHFIIISFVVCCRAYTHAMQTKTIRSLWTYQCNIMMTRLKQKQSLIALYYVWEENVSKTSNKLTFIVF